MTIAPLQQHANSTATKWSIIIIVIIISQIALHNENERDRKRPRKGSSIQYGYRKCGTRARVFSQTFAHGNSKNKIRQRHRGKMWGVKIESSTKSIKKSPGPQQWFGPIYHSYEVATLGTL